MAPLAHIGIVGTGLMGQGIAQIAAQAGIETLLHDTRPGAADGARTAIATQLRRLVEKGKLEARAAEDGIARLKPVASLGDLAGCDVVVEAIVEELDAKQQLFAALEKVVAPQCVLATNTSSLSVTAIAARCAHPGRVGGFHFFSPVPLMKIVEVVDGARTEPWVGERLVALAQRLGHAPVRAKDTPGFLVNHAGRGYGTEALRLLSEGVAEYRTIDDVLRDAAGFRMGPFELLDLTGLDVSQPVMESIYRQFYDEPRFRPSPLLTQRRAAGLLGRKAGEGFYRYLDGTQQREPAASAPDARPAKVWVSRADRDAHDRVVAIVRKLGTPLDTGAAPGADSLCVVTPWGGDATGAAMDEGLDAARTVALDAWFGLDKRRTLMTTPLTQPAFRDAAHGLFAADGVAVSVMRDCAGFIAPRVVAHIVNIACDIAQQRIATPEDIDRAVTLGLGYPRGPLAMGDAMGPARVLAMLKGLQDFYGDPRYRPSPWLTRRARLGVPLATAES
jgi:3-hydroxybutyryl-CoA dehydrogenase